MKCINYCKANAKFNKNWNTLIDHAANDFTVCESYKFLRSRTIAKTEYPYDPLSH